MAQGLLLGLGIPLWAGYLISTVMVIPLVIYGMKALSKLQVWTTPDLVNFDGWTCGIFNS